MIVLICEKTFHSCWVKHEIEKAWIEKKGLFRIYINNLKCPINGKSLQGRNPFEDFSSKIMVYNPTPNDAYNTILRNIENWIEEAIADSKYR